jgi:hypothetical protein
MPQVIVNKTKWKEEIEGLELYSGLAKQVLSQLSYTPIIVYFKRVSIAAHLCSLA